MSLEQAILGLTAELKRYNDFAAATSANKAAVAGALVDMAVAGAQAERVASEEIVKAKVKAEKVAKVEKPKDEPPANPYAAFGFDLQHAKAIGKLQTELKLDAQGAAQKFTSDAVLASVPKLGRDAVVAALQSAAGAAKVSAADPSTLGAIYAAVTQLVAAKDAAAEDIG